MSQAQLHEYTKIDPWFLAQLGELHQAEAWLTGQRLGGLSADDLAQVKRRGFSDPQIAKAVGARAARRPPACRPPPDCSAARSRPAAAAGQQRRPLGIRIAGGEVWRTRCAAVALWPVWQAQVASGRHRGRLPNTEGSQ